MFKKIVVLLALSNIHMLLTASAYHPELLREMSAIAAAAAQAASVQPVVTAPQGPADLELVASQPNEHKRKSTDSHSDPKVFGSHHSMAAILKRKKDAFELKTAKEKEEVQSSTASPKASDRALMHDSTDDTAETSATAAAEQQKPLICCDKTFNTLNGFKIHQGKVHRAAAAAQSKFAADTTTEDFDARQPQRKKAKPNEIVCPQCNETFQTTQGLGSHLKYKHPAAQASANAREADDATKVEAEFACTHADCNKTYKRQQDLTRHLKWHKRWVYLSDKDSDDDASDETAAPAASATAAAAALALAKKFPCVHAGCNRSYKAETSLMRHVRFDHALESVAARSGSAAVRAEKQKVTAAQLRCQEPNCGAMCKNAKGLKAHMRMSHKTAAPATKEKSDTLVEDELLKIKVQLKALEERETLLNTLKKLEGQQKLLRQQLFGNTGK